MDTGRITIKSASKNNQGKSTDPILDSSQEKMVNALRDLMCKNIKIDKKTMDKQLSKAIAEWQKIIGRPLKDEIKMLPIERIRISKSIFEILKDNLSNDLKGKKYQDQIYRALDLTLKYYEENFAYR